MTVQRASTFCDCSTTVSLQVECRVLSLQMQRQSRPESARTNARDSNLPPPRGEALVLALFRELYTATKPALGDRAKKSLAKHGARLLKAGSVVAPAADALGASGAGSIAAGAMSWLSDMIEDGESVEDLHKQLSTALAGQAFQKCCGQCECKVGFDASITGSQCAICQRLRLGKNIHRRGRFRRKRSFSTTGGNHATWSKPAAISSDREQPVLGRKSIKPALRRKGGSRVGQPTLRYTSGFKAGGHNPLP